MGPRTRLPEGAPRGHRIAHHLTAAGMRGADRYWRLATLRRPFPGHGVVEIADSVRLEVRPSDVGECLLYRGLHEREERAVITRFVDWGGTCLDVGANIGSYTALLALLTGESGRVIAFEPSAHVRRRLEKTVTGFRWVSVLPYALGDRAGQGLLSEVRHHTGRSTLRTAPRGSGPGTAVDVRRLDELDVLPASAEIDVMKVDVEGWEQSVIAGAGPVLADARVGALMLEASPEFGALDYLQSLLAHPRYTCWRIGARRSGTGLRLTPELVRITSPDAVVRQCNLIFVRDDRLHRVRDLLRR